jgi:alkylation response protein AidB-like acyl-CoA dehydrogenase
VLRPTVERIDRAGEPWEAFLAGREAYREMAKAGFTKSFIPTEYGGAGFSMIDFALAAEETHLAYSTDGPGTRVECENGKRVPRRPARSEWQRRRPRAQGGGHRDGLRGGFLDSRDPRFRLPDGGVARPMLGVLGGGRH